jgi:hypothetical protein
MDKRLSKKLRADFPELFRVTKGNEMKSFPVFGFQCDSGWFPLLYEACNELNNIRERPGRRIRIDQIKEKFGTLRFYISGGVDEADEIIAVAQKRSAKTCEVCGRPATLCTVGWYRTQCDDHSNGKTIDLEPLIEVMLLKAADKSG